MLDLLLLIGLVGIAGVVINTNLRLRRLERVLCRPLPSAVTSHGRQQLAPEFNVDYFKMKRDLYPAGSPRWRLYNAKIPSGD